MIIINPEKVQNFLHLLCLLHVRTLILLLKLLYASQSIRNKDGISRKTRKCHQKNCTIPYEVLQCLQCKEHFD